MFEASLYVYIAPDARGASRYKLLGLARQACCVRGGRSARRLLALCGGR